MSSKDTYTTIRISDETLKRIDGYIEQYKKKTAGALPTRVSRSDVITAAIDALEERSVSVEDRGDVVEVSTHAPKRSKRRKAAKS